MPPKRKRQASPERHEATPDEPVHPTTQRVTEDSSHFNPALLDMWTDDQESCLLKAVIRWKPVGMHKHFRMASIYDYMRNEGLISPTDRHMTIPGIWAKLGSLYNLPVLDEREDSLTFDTVDSNKTTEDSSRAFSLPEPDFGDMMFQRRLNPDASESPPASAMGDSVQESAVADTEEPGSSPAHNRSHRSQCGTRSTAREARNLRRKGQNETSAPSTAAPSPNGEDASVDGDGDTKMDEDGGEDDESTSEDEDVEADSSIGRGSTRRGTRQSQRGKAIRGRGGGRRGGRGR